MGASANSAERQTLEARLRALEDRAEIADLIASYGPIVDAGAGEALGGVWIADGEYLVGDEYHMHGAEIAALTELAGHQRYLAAGCAHVLSAPVIRIENNTASAVNHSVVLVREGERWVADRVSANAWEFVRTAEGWRVRSRRNALLDGDAVARGIFGAFVAPGAGSRDTTTATKGATDE